MTLAIGFRGEGKVTDSALERTLTIMRSQMTNQSALVSARVGAQVTLVRRQAKVTSDMT